MRLVIILIFYCTLNNFIQGQQPVLDKDKVTCVSRQNCADCIKDKEGCSWCSQPDFHGADKQPLGRCNTTIGHAELGRFQCQSEFLFSPKNEFVIIKDKEITKSKPIENSDTVPMRPQEISIKLRIGEPAEVKIVYRDPEDYPLDLYYLMDLTKTMEDDKEVLANLGDQLGSSISDITTKFRQGFGSFVDKVAMPYVMMTPKQLANPCGNETCVKPYGFRNHLKISSETEEFSKVVREATLSASIDKPEGGFDALMQTMVCNNEIGWGAQSRRLVIFATDAPFHIAGDGKLGGIIHPNDGKCHMNENGEYTHSTVMDYPSIAQLNQKAIQNSISIIFAVTSNQVDIYNQTAKRIEGAKTAELSKDSSNIVELVKEEYRMITSKVQISDNLPKYVRVKYFSKCVNDALEEEYETDTCSELPIGSILKFTAKLELIECPPNKEEWSQTYRIYRVGIKGDLTVRLDMLCDCPCEYPQNWIPKSEKCWSVGTEKCGLCDCDENYFGRFCECTAGSDGVPLDENKACTQANSTEVCSGSGECDCGQCICNKRTNPVEKYSGQYCECDNFSCDWSNGEICSGHGTCECGECQCSAGRTGNACQCSTDTSTCMDPLGLEMCSGQGECECGKCSCRGKYTGSLCEKCQHESCPTKCEELKPCVQCKLHGTGKHDNPSDCELNCFRQPINIVDVISYDSQSDEVYCKGEDEVDQCSFYFTYGQFLNKSIYINAQRTKECPPEPPTFWIVVGIISLIVVIGLGLILFWKIYTLIQDRKEYAYFQKETKNADFGTGTNPLYNDPVGVYQNPAYGKNQ